MTKNVENCYEHKLNVGADPCTDVEYTFKTGSAARRSSLHHTSLRTNSRTAADAHLISQITTQITPYCYIIVLVQGKAGDYGVLFKQRFPVP
jgi:hypothetical protein